MPDKVFALEVTFPDGRIERTHYFLEADRGTMPIERRDLRQSCVLRKLKAYEATHQSRILQGKLGGNRFRIVILTEQSERAAHIVESIAKVVRERKMFLVMTSRRHQGFSSLLG